MQISWTYSLKLGEPVLGIAINSNYLALGTAYGAVVIYDLDHKIEYLLTDRSEEDVSLISLSEPNYLYFAVGDYYGVKIKFPFHESIPKIIHYSRVHTPESCSTSIVFIKHNQCCLIATENSEILLLNFQTEKTTSYNSLPIRSIPLDFNNDEILIVQYSLNKLRKYSRYSYLNGHSDEFLIVGEDYGHITSPRMFSWGVVFIHNHKGLRLVKDTQTQYYVWVCEQPIVAYEIFENEAVWCACVDLAGKIYILKDWELLQEGALPSTPAQSKFFEMGYPYRLVMLPPYVALSTDHTVYLISFI
jgi:hypothetical protein